VGGSNAYFDVRESQILRCTNGIVVYTNSYLGASGVYIHTATLGVQANTTSIADCSNTNARMTSVSTKYSPATSGAEGNTSAIIVWS
jgi:hypothetical protein